MQIFRCSLSQVLNFHLVSRIYCKSQSLHGVEYITDTTCLVPGFELSGSLRQQELIRILLLTYQADL